MIAARITSFSQLREDDPQACVPVRCVERVLLGAPMMFPTLLRLVTLFVTAGALPQGPPIAKPAAVLRSGAVMTDAQIRQVLQAVLDVRKGRYVTARVLGTLPAEVGRFNEYWMHADDGRLQFMRFVLVDRMTKQETISVSEFTRQPAILCASGERRPGRFLAINYSHWGGKWQPPYGSVAIVAELDPVGQFLDASPGTLIDDGLRTVDGHRVRDFSWRKPLPTELGRGTGGETISIDIDSLLLTRAALIIDAVGKPVRVESGYEYPPFKPIPRPSGVPPPQCI